MPHPSSLAAEKSRTIWLSGTGSCPRNWPLKQVCVCVFVCVRACVRVCVQHFRPLVLWHSWYGNVKSIWPVQNCTPAISKGSKMTCACWRTERSSRTIGSRAAFLFAILLWNCCTMLDMSSSVCPFMWSNSLFIVDTLSIASCVLRYPLTPCRASAAAYRHTWHPQRHSI